MKSFVVAEVEGRVDTLDPNLDLIVRTGDDPDDYVDLAAWIADNVPTNDKYIMIQIWEYPEL